MVTSQNGGLYSEVESAVRSQIPQDKIVSFRVTAIHKSPVEGHGFHIGAPFACGSIGTLDPGTNQQIFREFFVSYTEKEGALKSVIIDDRTKTATLFCSFPDAIAPSARYCLNRNKQHLCILNDTGENLTLKIILSNNSAESINLPPFNRKLYFKRSSSACLDTLTALYPDGSHHTLFINFDCDPYEIRISRDRLQIYP
jgi:hypothetical protein